MASLKSVNMDKPEFFVIELSNPYTMMIAGPAKCGKTTFVGNLVEKAYEKMSIYSENPNHFFYFYNQAEPTNEKLRKHVHEFIEGMPDMEWLDSVYKQYGDNITIIIDDQALNVTKDVAEMFSVGSSRRNCNIIFITQNLFGKQKAARDISLNCSYVVLFKNPRDQISAQTFFRQYDPGNSTLLSNIFREATKKPFSYLFIDLKQKTSDMDRLLSNIFGEDNEPPLLFRY